MDTHTHTHTHTHTCTHTHTHTHRQTYRHSCIKPQRVSGTHTLHTHTKRYTLSLCKKTRGRRTDIQKKKTHAHVTSHIHTHITSHIHTHTHTHTHYLCLSSKCIS